MMTVMDGFIFVSIFVIVALLVMSTVYDAVLWHSRLIHKIRMKELDKRLWYYRMGLTETGCLTKHTRFLR